MATDTAKQIRNALKAAGYGPRDISVRARNYSTSSSVDVEIKRADIALSVIAPIVNAFQHVRRCEASGEILGGGNTFVGLSYTRECLDGLAETVRAQLAAGRVRFGTLELSADATDRYCVHVWDSVTGEHVAQFSPEHGHRVLARYLATRGELACLAAAHQRKGVET